MLHKHVIFTMHRHEKSRAHKVMHQLQLFAAGMAGHMDALIAAIDDIRAQFHKVVDGLYDQFFIAGYRIGGDNNSVTRYNSDLAVIRGRHACQSRHWLTLAARCADNDLLGAIVVNLVYVDDCAFGCMHIAQFHGDANHIHHAAPEYCNFALVMYRCINDLLYAVYV